MRKNATRMLYGLAIVIASVFIMLDKFGVINMFVGIWEFWPVLIIIAGIGAMIADKPNAWNIALICAGVFFQLLQFGIIQNEIARTVAFCFLAIAFGIWLMFGWIGNGKKQQKKNDAINGYYAPQNPYRNPNNQNYSNHQVNSGNNFPQNNNVNNQNR